MAASNSSILPSHMGGHLSRHTAEVDINHGRVKRVRKSAMEDTSFLLQFNTGDTADSVSVCLCAHVYTLMSSYKRGMILFLVHTWVHGNQGDTQQSRADLWTHQPQVHCLQPGEDSRAQVISASMPAPVPSRSKPAQCRDVQNGDVQTCSQFQSSQTLRGFVIHPTVKEPRGTTETTIGAIGEWNCITQVKGVGFATAAGTTTPEHPLLLSITPWL